MHLKTKLRVDFSGPYPNEKYLLVRFDEYYRHPIVEIIQSTKAFTVIPVIELTLFLFGIPETLKSDDGARPSFKEFANRIDFKLRKITPLRSKAHTECEGFMRALKKAQAFVIHGNPD